jgi:D-arabinose 1-dehydrogenase-like Zn-dependent alcohol dehydrogenase
MRAAVIPQIQAKWEIRDIPVPKPAANQVLIKIHASGLCYSDVHLTQGNLPFSMTFPCTAGHEPAGEIVELGNDVTTRKKGDRVGVPYLQSSCGRCEWCQRGKPYSVRSNKGYDPYRHSGTARRQDRRLDGKGQRRTIPGVVKITSDMARRPHLHSFGDERYSAQLNKLINS